MDSLELDTDRCPGQIQEMLAGKGMDGRQVVSSCEGGSKLAFVKSMLLIYLSAVGPCRLRDPYPAAHNIIRRRRKHMRVYLSTQWRGQRRIHYKLSNPDNSVAEGFFGSPGHHPSIDGADSLIPTPR